MNGSGLAHVIVALTWVEPVLALIALILLGKKHAWGEYKTLAALLVVKVVASAVSFVTLYLHFADRHLPYEIYFYTYWSSYIAQAILMLLFCYVILTRLFSATPKLGSISTRVFWGIVLLWGALSAIVLFNPHMNAAHLLTAEATQLQQLAGGVSFLTAMAVFVCIRRLGLPLRSSLPAFGLGLIFSAMIVFSGQLYYGEFAAPNFIWLQIFGGVAACAQLICWVAAISWSEPAARQTVSV